MISPEDLTPEACSRSDRGALLLLVLIALAGPLAFGCGSWLAQQEPADAVQSSRAALESACDVYARLPADKRKPETDKACDAIRKACEPRDP